jgi:tight adherence protein C
MIPAELIPILFFVCTTAGVMALISLIAPSRDRVAERIRSLSAGDTRKPETGRVRRLVNQGLSRLAAPPEAQKKDLLRLTHAGYNAAKGILPLRAIRLLLIIVPLAAAAILIATGILSLESSAIAGFIFAALGMIAPGIWLDSRKKAHQNELRRGLPDFFDVLVLCIEGGMSLLAAWRRVADELRLAYPTLWKELKLVEQEVDIGRQMGDSLQSCSERTDLDELTSLSSVVRQAERLGTEIARPMRNLSDTLRLQRVQRAEEAAHKTATKIMFPTLFFIFPGVFAILLGPMIIDVLNIFSGEQK